MNPTDIKEMAREFIAKNSPDFLEDVNDMWELLEEADIDNNSSLLRIEGGLSFGDEADPEVQEVMRIMAIFSLTFQQSQDFEELSKSGLLSRIKKNCSLMKIDAKLEERIINTVVAICSSGGWLQKVKSEVTFTETEVIFPDGEIFTEEYPLILFENLILQKRIHWLWGFVFFSSWTNGGDVLKSHPKFQFGNYFSKKKKQFEKFGLDFIHKRGSDEWSIDFESTKSNVRCNLLDAREHYEEASKEFGNGNFRGAVEKLELAVSPSGYERPMFIDAYNLLVECIFRLNYEGISEKLYNKVLRFLTWYNRRLNETISFIEGVYIRNEIIDAFDIEEELKSIKAEQKKAENNYKAIEKKACISESDKDYFELAGLFENLHKIIQKILAIDKSMLKHVYNAPEFNRLKDNMHVKEVFNNSIRSLKTLKPFLHDKEGTEEFLLFNLVQHNINFKKCDSLVALKKHLQVLLESEIHQMT